MLVSLRVENFKSFRDTQTIELAPLTILAGINSAGKSSIVQALLLLKQSLESAPSVVLNPGNSTYLEQSLGDKFSDFIFGSPPLEDATLVYNLACRYDKDKISDPSVRDLFDEIDALLPYPTPNGGHHSLIANVEITFAWGPFGHRGRPTIRVANLKITTVVKNSFTTMPLIGILIYPTNRGDYQLEPLLDYTDASIKGLNFQQVYLDGLTNFLPGPLLIDPTQPNLFEQNVPPAFARFFRFLIALIRQDLGENIYYLSSFRQAPIRYYPSGQTISDCVDPTGRNFAEILWRLREEPVSFYHQNLPEPKDLNLNKGQLPLKDMVTWVLEEVLQLKQRVSVQPVGNQEAILEVLVETLGLSAENGDRLKVPLSSVGLGYNQILPLVIQGLLTPPGAMVIYEQPEIHLHPEVQANLVPFFIGLIRSGRQVLVETHSNHIVDQLCLQIVKDREYELEKNAKVLFVHPPDNENNSSRIEGVQIDSTGVIQNYPKHFIPDYAGLLEQITKEGFKKRREKQKEG
jgi:predicted ATPase